MDFSGVANRQAFLKSNILVNPSLCYFLCFCLIVDNKTFITVLEIFLGWKPQTSLVRTFFAFSLSVSSLFGSLSCGPNV